MQRRAFLQASLLAGSAAMLHSSGLAAGQSDPLFPWRDGVKVRGVAPHDDRHVIHSYFNTCPESPDGRFVLYYTSGTRDGEAGDLRVLERSTEKELVIATDITAEDAHRAACQQWCNDGRTVVYHDCRDGRWAVVAVDLASLESRILVWDRQVAFGTPHSSWVPVYGCHWNPGEHRDLQLVHVETGEIRTVVQVADVLQKYGEWIQHEFETTEVSIFFPILSPDGKRVFFKMSRPGGGDDYRSKQASHRAGKVVYDLEEQRFVRLVEQWGHPSWSPKGDAIFEKGNFVLDLETGRSRRCAPSCFSNHPSIAPDGRVFVTDADVTKRNYGAPGDWAIGVGSMTADEFVVIDVFGNTRGATSWRHNHPHPVFSADGKWIYYNVNAGPWTELRVASSSAQ